MFEAHNGQISCRFSLNRCILEANPTLFFAGNLKNNQSSKGYNPVNTNLQNDLGAR
jgi:hypothetical protein